ncbi:MAG TPA: hypothetical protein VF708_18440 [Pyrinomonadaceae bacterium]|jgi:hypothetical protein
MVKLLIIFTLAILSLVAGSVTTAHGQGAQPTPAATTDAGITANGVIGEVTAIDAAANRLTVKTDAGASLSVVLNEKTAYMRLAPGEKTLTNAVKIQLADVAVGDRVWARGRVAEDQKSVPAIALIVMTKADLAEKHERERAEWRRRGIAGIITELNPNTKEITLSMRGRGEATPVLIPTTAGDVKFRRYAPDSVRFSDARPSSFAELKVGDQLRALGERSADGARFTPQEIVSGAFRTIGGAVTSVNAEAGELKIKDVQGGQTVTVVVSRDSLLRRLPPEMAARLARRAAGRSGGSGEGDEAANAPGARRREPGARSSAQEGQGSRRPGGGAGEGRGQNGDGARTGRGGFDFQEMLERLPALPLAELKPGDMIIVSSTVGAEASRVTAIKLVAGVDELLNTAAQRRQGRQGGGGGGGAGDSGLGLDSGTIDFGIGLP